MSSPCEGRGAVVFDGTTCSLSTAAECGAMEGAFDTYEACALACASSGYCDATKLAEWGNACDWMWLFFGPYEPATAACSLGMGWDCTEPPEVEPAYGSPGTRCWRNVGPVGDDVMQEICALTLLPSVSSIYCFNYL